MVRELVGRAPLLMNAPANGRFFQQCVALRCCLPVAMADCIVVCRGRSCYYGEYALHFCVSTNQIDLAKILIDAGQLACLFVLSLLNTRLFICLCNFCSGADMNKADSNGNTVLHMCVIHELPNVYTWLKKEWIKRYAHAHAQQGQQQQNSKKSKKHKHIEHKESKRDRDQESGEEAVVELWQRQNNEVRVADTVVFLGYVDVWMFDRVVCQLLTPLTLAAKLAKTEMFSFLITERRQVQVSCFCGALRRLPQCSGVTAQSRVRCFRSPTWIWSCPLTERCLFCFRACIWSSSGLLLAFHSGCCAYRSLSIRLHSHILTL